ncbi:hypothetical protein A2U01_0072844, partial [Trifolium medium]|nr:hypothetical protein [Trifolium medium]
MFPTIVAAPAEGK